jgi:hypothetical protein
MRPSRKRIAIAFASATLFISGCASYDGRNLVRGEATQAEIVATMGKPAQTLPLADGGKALYFSKLPYGRQMFVATTGPDGRLKGIEQVLDHEHIHRIQPGTTTAEQVRKILGPPYRISRANFKPFDVWEYPWDGEEVLWVSLSDDGIVREIDNTVDNEVYRN